MNVSRSLCLFASVFIAIPIVYAQTPGSQESKVPDGSPSRISDWALSGVIWSDASLTKKLADSAATEADSAAQATRYRELSRQSSEIIEAMEEFGWKQVTRTTNLNDGRSQDAAMNRDPSTQPNTSPLTGDNLETPPERTGLQRFDTETPANRDDPGLDDERTGDNLSLDVDNYRVDDYVDETPSERRNRADAIEDGVEGAIAAASGRLGTGRGTAGHISVRESQTLSATLPYSRDSIYDADDYDPDVDFLVENPEGTRSVNPRSVDVGDQDDDIDGGVLPETVDGEDELMAAMSRERGSSESRARNDIARTPSMNLDNYTTERSKHAQDANWVQFHLSANQSVWSDFTTRGNLTTQLDSSIIKLKASMKAAMDATDNESLRDMLSQF